MVSLGLEDKVIVVTGGARGIGAAIVALLQQLQAKVAYTDIKINEDKNGALAIEADVTNWSSMR